MMLINVGLSLISVTSSQKDNQALACCMPTSCKIPTGRPTKVGKTHAAKSRSVLSRKNRPQKQRQLGECVSLCSHERSTKF